MLHSKFSYFRRQLGVFKSNSGMKLAWGRKLLRICVLRSGWFGSVEDSSLLLRQLPKYYLSWYRAWWRHFRRWCYFAIFYRNTLPNIFCRSQKRFQLDLQLKKGWQAFVDLLLSNCLISSCWRHSWPRKVLRPWSQLWCHSRSLSLYLRN